MHAALNFTRLQDLIDQDALRGKRVFIRADLNVPQDDAGNITEDTRIRASVPCVRMALDAGAAVMVTSHLGRPTEGAFKPEDSLAPVAARLSELLGREVPLRSNWVDGVDVETDVGSNRARRPTTITKRNRYRVVGIAGNNPNGNFHFIKAVADFDNVDVDYSQFLRGRRA